MAHMTQAVPLSNGLNMRTPQDVDRAVRTACFAGVIAGLMVIISTWSSISKIGVHSGTLFGLFSGALMFALAYGMTRYNRACAVALLLLYATGKLMMVFTQTQRLSIFTGLIALMFVFAFVRGVQGTFVHHQLKTQYDDWKHAMDRDLDPGLFDDELT